MHQIWELQQMQSLPLSAKVVMTQQRIREWYEHWDGMVYVSFSGGKDSTVLLHLVRDMYPDVPAVFSDTGLEFPEIREFVKTIPNVTWLKPDMTFRKVLEKYGYPVIGKEQSKWIDEARRGNAEGQSRRLYGIRKGDKKSTFRISEQWHYLMNAPFKISDECCNEMKKKPMKRYAHETGRVPIIGTMAEESKLRTQHWLQEGCNAYDAKRPTSKPMSFWTEADVWQYIRENNIPYSKIYDMGYGRTGCIFCMFGAHFDGQPTRFQRLQRTHPKLWRYCMKDWEAGGLGMRQVLEYMGIPFENYIGEINGNTENPDCPLESCGLQSPCRSQAGRQGIRETETVNQ